MPRREPLSHEGATHFACVTGDRCQLRDLLKHERFGDVYRAMLDEARVSHSKLETVAAERDRYREALREIAEYGCSVDRRRAREGLDG